MKPQDAKLKPVSLRWPVAFWRKVRQIAINRDPPQTLQSLITECVANELKIDPPQKDK